MYIQQGMSNRKYNLYTKKPDGKYERDKISLPPMIPGTISSKDNCWAPEPVSLTLDPREQNFFQINVQGRLYNNDGDNVAYYRDKDCKTFTYVELPTIHHDTPSAIPSLKPTSSPISNCEVPDCDVKEHGYQQCCGDFKYHECVNTRDANFKVVVSPILRDVAGGTKCCQNVRDGRIFQIHYNDNCPAPTTPPTRSPSSSPSVSQDPSASPTVSPSDSTVPSPSPSKVPTVSSEPSANPSMTLPSNAPSVIPSLSSNPSALPSLAPSSSFSPSAIPSTVPSISASPSGSPSENPSSTSSPSRSPSEIPSSTSFPSSIPSNSPSSSLSPSAGPSDAPSISFRPSEAPSKSPSLVPSGSQYPSSSPSKDDCVCVWDQKGSDIYGEDFLDMSGGSVSISDNGTIVAIGAIKNDGNSTDIGNNQGHVRVFSFNGTSWLQLGADIDGIFTQDHFGYAVHLSGDGSTLAVGAPKHDSFFGEEDIGHVRVFKYNGTVWNQVGSDIEGVNVGDANGQSVALSVDGSVLVIGSMNSGSNAGAVRLYDFKYDGWVQRGYTLVGESAQDYSGYSVALSKDGNIVAIGAVYNDGNGEDSGHVRVFEWNSRLWESRWEQLGPDIDGKGDHDMNGYSVSLSSNGYILATSAPKTNESKGRARVYEFNGTTWIQRGNDLSGAEFYDNFGESVSISADGNRVAVGAPSSEITVSGIVNNGHAQLYEWEKSADDWNPLGQKLGGLSLKDRFGTSVALSKNGVCLAVGGPDHDVFKDDAIYRNGHVQIHCLDCNNHCSHAPSGIPSEAPFLMTMNPSTLPSISHAPSQSIQGKGKGKGKGKGSEGKGKGRGKGKGLTFPSPSMSQDPSVSPTAAQSLSKVPL